jgi:hypothetical protein
VIYRNRKVTNPRPGGAGVAGVGRVIGEHARRHSPLRGGAVGGGVKITDELRVKLVSLRGNNLF